MIPQIASLLAGLFTGGGKVPAEQRRLMTAQTGLTTQQTELAKLEALMQQLLLGRKQAQDPLWRAVQSMAFNRLPTFAKAGFDMSSMQNPITSSSYLPPPPPGSRPRPPGVPPIDTAIPRRT
jgi:hypothetical protein